MCVFECSSARSFGWVFVCPCGCSVVRLVFRVLCVSVFVSVRVRVFVCGCWCMCLLVCVCLAVCSFVRGCLSVRVNA